MTRTLARTDDPPIVHGQSLPMTFEEFLALPDRLHAEWVDGEVYVFMPSTNEHQDIVGLLYSLLNAFARTLGLGRVLLAPYGMDAIPGRSYREPDIGVVATEHLDRISRTRLIGPADLAIEVISEDSVRRDRHDKRREYGAIGVREYWIFDSRPGQHQAEFLGLVAGRAYEAIGPDEQGRVRSRVLPGFWLRPEWCWTDPLPAMFDLLDQIMPGVLRIDADALERFRRRIADE